MEIERCCEAWACGARAVGVVMTGMGEDGAAGIGMMHRAGAWAIAQDETTSLVYGMPKAAAATGAVDHILSLQKIPAATSRPSSPWQKCVGQAFQPVELA